MAVYLVVVRRFVNGRSVVLVLLVAGLYYLGGVLSSVVAVDLLVFCRLGFLAAKSWLPQGGRYTVVGVYVFLLQFYSNSSQY